MTSELAEEVQSRVDTQLESRDGWDEGEERTQEDMEDYALEDVVSLGRDCGGLFEFGIVPSFTGSSREVAELREKQAANLADMERQ